jgi:hypothetical protein
MTILERNFAIIIEWQQLVEPGREEVRAVAVRVWASLKLTESGTKK